METTMDFFDNWDNSAVNLDTSTSDGEDSSATASVVEDIKSPTISSAVEEAPTKNVEPSVVSPTERCQGSNSKKRKRQTPKQEIARLRLHVHHLTHQLEAVRQEAQTRAQAQHGGHNLSSTAQFWKELARRQCQHRVNSEHENERLRKIVRHRIVQAKRLQKYSHPI